MATTYLMMIKTGLPILDSCLPGGEIPAGSVVEIAGLEQSGKTTIALMLSAWAQRRGMQTAYLDMERTWDPTYASSLELDTGAIVVCEPSDGESAIRVGCHLLRGGVKVLVIDSLAAMRTPRERVGTDGAYETFKHRELVASACARLGNIARSSGAILLLTNQLRATRMGPASGDHRSGNLQSAGGPKKQGKVTLQLNLSRRRVLMSSGNYVGFRIGVDIRDRSGAKVIATEGIDIPIN